jgi:beta-glucosidase
MFNIHQSSSTKPGFPGAPPNQAMQFPKGFLWGAATSAFQVEGHPEETSARCSDWSHWTTGEKNVGDGTTADQACQFYLRYSEDLAICRELNMNAFRIGLNWPVLRPEIRDDLWLEPTALAYYKDLLRAMKAQGMTTFVTLFHFCLPRELAAIGGWNNPKTVDQFVKFAEAVAAELGDLVDYWLTLNEPLVYVYHGWIAGKWPPGEQENFAGAWSAIRNLLEGHARAYHAIKKHQPQSPISYTLHWRPFHPRNPLSPLDRMVTYYRDQVFNHLFPRAVDTGKLQFPFPINQTAEAKAVSGSVPMLKGTMDYLAINYYTREVCQFNYSKPIDLFGMQSQITMREVSDLGWEIYPEGLFEVLTREISHYRLDANGRVRPIIITENGMASVFPAHLSEGDWSLDDQQRARYLTTHIAAMHHAIQNGANVKGYLHWSLIDNFEWADGLSARFGLVRVSYPTQERHLRASARIYAKVAAQNALDLSALSR